MHFKTSQSTKRTFFYTKKQNEIDTTFVATENKNITMIKTKALIVLIIASCTMACTNTKQESENKKPQTISEPNNRVVLSSEINWESLNPARGDQSPKAGTIWGDRNGSEPTGFLVKFKDGFSSPPHIHNVTYRALVINGLIHNDDPDAKKMWMSAGSFWTQPAGESHITAAKGSENIAYVEIDAGPYLVKPIEEAFDNGERPVNLDKTNIVWLDASMTSIIDKGNIQNPANGPAITFLWSSNDLKGYLLKLSPEFEGKIMSHGEIFHAVVIAGESDYKMPKTEEIKSLDAGSYFSSEGKSIHQISSKGTTESLIYIRTNGKLNIIQEK